MRRRDPLTKPIQREWNIWKPNPRSVALKLKIVTSIDIHLFNDANKNGVCAVAYAVIKQPNIINQGLIAIL